MSAATEAAGEGKAAKKGEVKKRQRGRPPRQAGGKKRAKGKRSSAASDEVEEEEEQGGEADGVREEEEDGGREYMVIEDGPPGQLADGDGDMKKEEEGGGAAAGSMASEPAPAGAVISSVNAYMLLYRQRDWTGESTLPPCGDVDALPGPARARVLAVREEWEAAKEAFSRRRVETLQRGEDRRAVRPYLGAKCYCFAPRQDYCRLICCRLCLL